MKNSSLLRSALPFLIILVALGAAFVMIKAKKPPEKEEVVEKAFLVEAQEVYVEPVEFVVYSQGDVVPKNQTRISSQVSGIIVDISPVFVEGGFFNKGEILLTLEQDDYLTEVKLAEAELARATAALEEEVARGKVAEEEWRSVNNTVPPALGLRKPQLMREQANLKAAKAQLERAQRNLARTEIKAPYNGVVVSRDVDLGQFLPIGTAIGEIFSTDVAEVRLPLTNSDLSILNINAGVEAQNTVTLTANVAGQQRSWQGKLVRSEGVMDSGSRVMFAIVEILDPYIRKATTVHDTALRFGQFVQAVVSGTKTEEVVVLPRNLLRLDNTVITITDDREIEIKNVEVARSDAQRVYIRSGLESGSRVAVSAVPNAFNGMKVRLPSDEPEVEEPSKFDQADDDESLSPAGE